MIRTCLALSVTLLAAGCSEPDRWGEFHGTGRNVGYVGVSTPNAELSSTKWIQNVGPTGFSSPAIAPDGTIYLGNAEGVLWGWNPDGTLRYKAEFPTSDMLSSVAIATDGLIYFTYLRTLSGGYYFSMLCRVEPSQTLKLLDCADFPEGGITTAPPKLWEHDGTTYAFVPSYVGPNRDLLVFSGGQIVSKLRVNCPAEVQGGDDDAWKIFLGILTGGLSLAIPQLNPIQFTIAGIDSRSWHLDPAVGILDRSSEGRAIIVAAFGGCRVQGFEFNVSDKQLKFLWQENKDAATYYSSPAIFFNGTTSIGRSDGHVRTFHAMNGTLDWDFDAGAAALATPAIDPGGDLYVVAEKELFLVNGGQKVTSVKLPTATQSSPALSQDHVHVAYSTGMVTFDHTLLRSAVTDNRIVGGLSSPAISTDGSVYVATTDGFLYAFK